MKIKFCGAATGVTGSCHLLTTENHKILLDCGMFQGGKANEALNFQDFPFDPAEIECVVISHAHIDHCGRLPLLVKRGFKGPIYATDASAELMEVMLKDSAHIAEQDAEQANRKRRRAGLPDLEPLYTAKDAEDTLKFITPVRYNFLQQINDEMKICFNDAGHILGSAIVEVWTIEDGKKHKTVFSGDLGMPKRPILKDPTYIKKADTVIMETTYGNRIHQPNAESISKLLDIAVMTVRRGGNVVIPSFAVGRTQELLYELNKVYDGKGPMHDALKDVPVYVDSPMSATATEVFRNNAQAYDQEMRDFIMHGDHPLDFAGLHFSVTSEESQRINVDPTPKIIISASGMCDAGRIRHHLKHNLWNRKNSIVFVGYQAEGSLGRRIIEGAETVTLFGEEIAVKAEVYNLEGFSGHADQTILYDWLNHFQEQPKDIFLVHGEKQSKEDFADYVKAHNGWDCTVVNSYDEYEIAAATTLVGTTAEEEFASDEELANVRERIAQIHEDIEKVLYGTTLAMQAALPPEKLAELKNTVQALEDDLVRLGSGVTLEEREHK